MASFKQAKSPVDAKYDRRTRVFLESAEDVRIFNDHWFSNKQDKLKFVSAEGDKSGGGGCRVVIAKVEEEASQNIKVHGIVDRDVLLSDADASNNDLFWETDDAIFHAAKPYGDNIHVLRRWELENYLLKPHAFAEEVARRIARSPAPPVSADMFLEQAEDIIQVTALTTYSVSKGKSSPKPAFGTNIPSGSDLSQEIDKFLKTQFPSQASDISVHIEKIKTFARDGVDFEEKWDSLSRILDGKKSLVRLCKHLSNYSGLNSISHWEEMRGCLANIIASKKKIDVELLELIDKISVS
ncbi:hypothetical protein JCM14076_11110 [Methylosoma difficile]